MFKKWSIEDIKEVLNEAVEKGKVSIDNVEIKISSKRNKRSLGSCESIKTIHGIRTVKIQISYWLANGYYDEESVRNTILHEYAHHHANTIHNESCNHDYRWKESCILVGAKPERLAMNYKCDYAQLKEDMNSGTTYQRKKEPKSPKYKLTCKCCEKNFYKHRLKNGVEWYKENYVCGYCNGALEIEILR